ncbi:MAG: VRR-NUC domain-containing protein [Candidatus Paceibacterota bacterium]|jgi:hypothetical protein
MKIEAKFYKALGYPFGEPIKNHNLDINEDLYDALTCDINYSRNLNQAVTNYFIKKFIEDTCGEEYYDYEIEDFQTPVRWHIKSIFEEFKLNLPVCPGIPDFFIGNNEEKRHFWIEVKINSDSLRRSQIDWIKNNKTEESYILNIIFK